jgi:hypothetical protein
VVVDLSEDYLTWIHSIPFRANIKKYMRCVHGAMAHTLM